MTLVCEQLLSLTVCLFKVPFPHAGALKDLARGWVSLAHKCRGMPVIYVNYFLMPDSPICHEHGSQTT